MKQSNKSHKVHTTGLPGTRMMKLLCAFSLSQPENTCVTPALSAAISCLLHSQTLDPDYKFAEVAQPYAQELLELQVRRGRAIKGASPPQLQRSGWK